MKYNYIGDTGLKVSELCFGTMTFGGQDAGMWSKIGQLQQKEVNDMLGAVIESGINFIDTANVYSFHRLTMWGCPATIYSIRWRPACKGYR